ncbi:hypothetical protein G4B88_021735 [Cannabis sativa]|uniref:Ubiquitin-like protease family profile domain-containing protein n=1 Tax=Cannabis sativa TaxID=3483 RepID=A0A7J6FB18_CANSA|nr:hypothetical protein G4B88_021735 [Cannabis sativa]
MDRKWMLADRISQEYRNRGSSCQLAVCNEANIVASGIVIDKGLPGTNYMTVMRMTLVPIPCPSLDIIYVDQSAGTLIPWPRHLVITSNDIYQQADHDTTSGDILQRSQPLPQEKQPLINHLTQVMQTPLEQIHNIVSRWADKDECFNPIIEKEDDILQFTNMQKIGQAVVVCYMRLLYKYVVKQNCTNKFLFVNPNIVATLGGSFEDRAQNLFDQCKQLKSKGQLMVVPWVHGEHWMLLILAPYAYYVACCDPVNVDLQNREEIVLLCPCQEDDVVCGYFMLRMLKDLIESHQSPKAYFNQLTLRPYTQKQIDDMRQQWAADMLPSIQNHKPKGGYIT